MSDKQLNELPTEVKEKLPESAQQIFLAAFNSACSDGMDEEAAQRVGWNSISEQYEQGDDGTWHRRPEDSNYHNKAITSGGN